MGKGENMPNHHQRRMLGAHEIFEQRFPNGKQYKWKEIQHISMLYQYTPKQLSQRYQNLKQKHNVGNLDEFDDWVGNGAAPRHPRRESVRAPLEPVMSVAGMPKTFEDVMNDEERRRSQLSPPASPIRIPTTARHVNPQQVLKKDLELVSKFVSAPTLVSQDLFEYIGANTGVSFRRFLELAKPYAKAVLLTQDTQKFNFNARSEVLEDMATLRDRFGPAFDRNRNRDSTDQEHNNVGTSGSSRDISSHRAESTHESDMEEIYYDENYLGENRFGLDDSLSEFELEEVAVGVNAERNEPLPLGLSPASSSVTSQSAAIDVEALIMNESMPFGASQSSSVASQSVAIDVEAVMNEFVYPGLSSQSSSEGSASLTPDSSPIVKSAGKKRSQVDVGVSPKLQSSGPAQKKRRDYSEPVTPTVRQRQCYELMEIPELPKGYAAMFPNRLLIDAEWRMVLETKRDFTRLNEEEWKFLLEYLKIQCVKTGKQIMDDFYCKLVPRIRERVFGGPGKETKIFLGTQHRYAVVVIYHCIQADAAEPTNEGTQRCIQNLIEAGILDDALTAKNWQLEFMRKLFNESCDYFCTGEKSFNDFLWAYTGC